MSVTAQKLANLAVIIAAMMAVALAGVILLAISFGASQFIGLETEQAEKSDSISVVAEASASSGEFIQFNEVLPPPPPPPPPPSDKEWKVLPWGDSNTEGGNGPGWNCSFNQNGYSYRGKLYQLLVEAGYKIDYIGNLSTNAKCGGFTEDIPDNNHGGYGAFSITDPSRDSLCDNRSPGVRGCGLLENIDVMAVADAEVILLMAGHNGSGNKASQYETLVNATVQKNPNAIIFSSGYPSLNGSPGAWQEIRNKSREIASRSSTDKIYHVDLDGALGGGEDFIDSVHHSRGGAAKVAQRFFDTIVASGALE